MEATGIKRKRIDDGLEFHREWRETNHWTSFGRKGDEPKQKRKVKDISDSHLAHIIGYLVDLQGGITVYSDEYMFYLSKTLLNFMTEAHYRAKYEIFVKDYEDTIYKKALKYITKKMNRLTYEA